METKTLYREFTYSDLYKQLGEMIACSGEGVHPWDQISGDTEDDFGNPMEPISYYVIYENAANFLKSKTTLPVYYSPETDLYYLGELFYGSSPEYESASHILTEDGIDYFEFQGWHIARVSDHGDTVEIEGHPGIVYKREINGQKN